MLFKANCKLNLHLQVTSKREDGYHNIESIFTEIPFYDELTIEATNTDQVLFAESGLKIPPCKENICITAANLLKNKAGKGVGCKIMLNKYIPTGAGLGGGSSDAAAVLKALNQLWNLNINTSELQEIAVKVGADVPFFIEGGSALVTGIGDVLKPIKSPLKKGYIVLINNGIHISTEKAYKNIKKILTSKKERVKFSTLFEEGRNEWNYKFFENDFESYAFLEYPELKRLRQMMYEKGAYLAGMTGSGSTIFGCFSDKNDISWTKIKRSNQFTKVVKVSGGSCGNY